MLQLALKACFVDLQRARVQRDGVWLHLTPRERALLERLARRPGEVVSRERLLAEAWGVAEHTATRRVDNAVRRLRVKLERDPSAPEHLLKVYGEGYRLELLGSTGGADVGFVGRALERAWLERALQDTAAPLTLLGPPGAGRRALLRALSSGRAVPGVERVRVADAPSGAPGERLLVLGGLSQAAAWRLVGGRVPGEEAAWRPLLDAVQRLPLPLLELCERARLLSPEALQRRLLEDPEALLPRWAERCQARWAALDAAIRRDLRRVASFARARVPLADAEALLGEGALPRLEALLLRGLLLRVEGEALELPLLLRRLASGGAEAEHAAWCLARAEALHARLGEADAEAVVDEIIALLPELLQAHAASLPGAPERAARLALAVNTALRRRGRLDLIAALEQAGEGSLEALSPLWRSRWLQLRAERRRVQGALEGAGADAERALQDAEQAGDPVELGMARGLRGVVAHTRGLHAQAEQDYRQAAALLVEGPVRSRASWLGNLAVLLARRGADAEAEATLEELIALWRREGDARMLARAQGELARVYIERGRGAQAEALLSEATARWEALGDPQALAIARLRWGLLRLDQGRLDEARAALGAAEAEARRLGEPRTRAQAMGYLGVAWWLEGEAEAASRALRACVALHRAEVGAGLEVAALGWLTALEASEGRAEAARAAALEARALEDPPGPLLRLQLCWPALSRGEERRLAAQAWQRARAVLAELEPAARRDVELRLAWRRLSRRVGGA
ncbi:MAG: winged helix-turn-helix domain-containing protein [Alphaproteobacteria bacterium]|nr:winged helix-turn-helix domain-containing protein [Alphaproteobacteria bacterium]